MTKKRPNTPSGMATRPTAAPAPKQAASKLTPARKPPGSVGKIGKVVALLRRSKGATIADLMKATDWQAHSVRGAISGSIKKKLDLAVISEKSGSMRVYRIKG